MIDDPIVRPHHIRAAGVCMDGARDWAKEHGINWSRFLDDGLPVSRLEPFNDALMNRICRIAREEANGRGQ